MERVRNPHFLDQRRKPEADHVHATDKAEVRERKHVDLGILERCKEGFKVVPVSARVSAGLLELEVMANQGLLLSREPLRLLGLIVKVEEDIEPEESRGKAFEDEHPLPAPQAPDPG